MGKTFSLKISVDNPSSTDNWEISVIPESIAPIRYSAIVSSKSFGKSKPGIFFSISTLIAFILLLTEATLSLISEFKSTFFPLFALYLFIASLDAISVILSL